MKNFLLTASSALLFASSSFAQLPDVAIVAAEPGALTGCAYADVQAYLLATGQFGNVDVLDALNTTPTLGDLAPYEVVLTWSNTHYSDPVLLGDTLADYSDGGGAVVVAVFATTTTHTSRYLQGRWLSGYEIIDTALGHTNTSASLGTIVVAGHPIMAGVANLQANSAFRPNVGTPLLQGNVVAEWGDGATLVAVGMTPGRVDLGLYPPSSNCSSGFWNIAGDGDLLIANALTFAVSTVGPGSIGTNYCTAAPNSTGQTGRIFGTGSAEVALNALTLNAEALPPNQFGIFIVSATQGFVAGAGGTSNGNLCLGGNIGRYRDANQILPTGAAGAFSLQIDLTAIPQGNGTVAAMAGDTWNFQAWHREGVGLGSNFTDGLEVTLQ